jgi:phenylpyruvate tautomerase PptA (4-oxalocrotonate tautomerase family)
MPMLELTIPTGTLDDPATRARLADDLATAMLRWEGAPDTPVVRDLTWVYVHEAALHGAPRFRVDVTVPAGTFSSRRKAGFMAEAHELVTQAAGLAADEALHVWTLFREVPEGDWGAGGEVVTLERLRAMVSAD